MADDQEVNATSVSEASATPCRMPCSREGCFSRCDKDDGHGPPHSCPVHGDF